MSGGGPIGQIFGVIGDQKATSAEVSALKANANWYMEQAEFARQSTNRELKIHDYESSQFYGDQVSAISRGGIDMSGSPIMLLAETKMLQYDERQAIIAQGNLNFKEASLKGTLASQQAGATASAGRLRAVSGAIGIGTSAFSLGMSSADTAKKSKVS